MLDTLGKALVASGKDVEAGKSMISFASQLRSGKGNSDELTPAILSAIFELL